jgi:ATP-dependent Clp protease ATP-binding subunit ClpC
MFERYTEAARRIIFFARYEAAAARHPAIDSTHLLLGLLREPDGATTPVLERAGLSYGGIQKDVRGGDRESDPVAPSVDIPLTPEVRRALEYAGDEAERLHARHVGSEHLLLGLLREPEGPAALVLRGHGLSLDDVREEVRLASSPRPSSPTTDAFPGLARFLAELDARRAGYHVRAFHGTGVRVEVAAAEAKCAVTFFADRITIEMFSSAGTIQDGGGLAEVLDRLGPPR